MALLEGITISWEARRNHHLYIGAVILHFFQKYDEKNHFKSAISDIVGGSPYNSSSIKILDF
jgi:hypothetical protein